MACDTFLKIANKCKRKFVHTHANPDGSVEHPFVQVRPSLSLSLFAL